MTRRSQNSRYLSTAYLEGYTRPHKVSILIVYNHLVIYLIPVLYIVTLFRLLLLPESIQMSEKECLLVMSMILKVADLGHCARDLSCHFKWVQNLTEEFYLQGDAEKSFNYPICSQHDRKLWVSPLTKDRYKGLPRCVASEQVTPTLSSTVGQKID